MKPRLFSAVWASLILLSCASDRKSAESVLNLKQGDEFLYTTIISQDIEQVIEGRKITVKQDSEFGWIMFVKERKADRYLIETEYRNIRIKFGGNAMQAYAYDSSSPENSDPAMKLMDMMIGVRFSLDVAFNGRILAVRGLETIEESLKKKGGALPPGYLDRLSPEKLTEDFNSLFGYLPDEPFRKDLRWKNTYVRTVTSEKMTFEDDWKCLSVDSDRARLEMKSTIKTDSARPDSPARTSSPAFSINGSQNASYTVDTTTGLLTKGKITQDLRGDIEIPSPGGEQKGVKGTMRIRSDITNEVKRFGTR